MNYRVLKTIVDFFNLKTAHPVELYTTYCAFETIVNPALWFGVRGNALADEKYLRDFFGLIDETKIPFLAILNQEGLWFANINYKHHIFKKQKRILFEPTVTEIKDGYLIYNYPILWFELTNIDEYFRIPASILDKLPGSIDYFIGLKSFNSWDIKAGSFVFKIHLDGFVFNGALLTHLSYDSGDKLTVAFLKEIAEITGQIAKIYGTRIEIDFPEAINLKSRLLDEIEIKFIRPKYKNFDRIYETEYDANINLRLEKLKRILKNL